MTMFDAALILSILLCSLVAGLLFTYAVVVMPGLKSLDDKQFIKAFQVTDRVIQDNHPLFLLVWVGSALALIVCAITGLPKMQGIDFFLLLFATVGYLAGVQAITIVIHLPLNNRLQKTTIENMTEKELEVARISFEPRWNGANEVRTLFSVVASMLLIILCLRQ